MPKLTKAVGEAVEPGAFDVFVWDREMKGFGIRVKLSGVRSFLVQYRNARGQSKRLRGGQLGVIAADQARTKAKKLLAQVILNADPKAKQDEIRAAPTLAMLCSEYLKTADSGVLIIRRGKPKAASTIAIDRGRIEHHILPSLGSKLVRDLKTADVRVLFAAITSSKTAANRPSEKLRGRVLVESGSGTAKKPSCCCPRF